MSSLKRKRLIVFLAEFVLLAICIVRCFAPVDQWDFQYDALNCSGGILVEMPEMGYYIDSSMPVPEVFIQTQGTDLGRGSYRFVINYKAEGNGASVSLDADDATYRLILGRQNMPLEAGERKEFMLYLSKGVSGCTVKVNFAGDGYLWIDRIQIIQTRDMERMECFVVFLLIAGAEVLWQIKSRNTKLVQRVRESANVWGALLAGVCVASFPCFGYYLPDGFDLNFHLMRIEEIAGELKNLQFPVRMQTEWLGGYGYPVSIFYGDTLLYIPAVLRLIGFPLQTAYKIFLFIVNMFTIGTGYLAIERITHKKWIGIMGGWLYLLLPYRLMCVYVRAGVGEYTAMIFLPLVVLGIYQALAPNVDKALCKRAWLPLVIGYSGLLQSHLLSMEIAAFFSLAVCCICWKKAFTPDRLRVWLKTAAGTLISNLFFLVPFLDYILRDRLTVTEGSSAMRIESHGAFLSQVLSLFSQGDTISLSVAEGLGVGKEMTFSLGIVVWAACFLAGYWYINLKKQEEASQVGVIVTFGLFGAMGIWMSTPMFPWDSIEPLLGKFSFIIRSLQFPWRILPVSSILLICMIGILTERLYQYRKMAGMMVGMALAGTSTLCGAYLLSGVVETNNSCYIADAGDLDPDDVMGGEYLPTGVDIGTLLSDKQCHGENATVEEYRKARDGYIVQVAESGKDASISLPLLYYRGYAAWNAETLERLNCYAGENGRVSVSVPEGMDGEVNVSFRPCWYWRLAEIVSGGYVVCIIAWYLRKARREKQ